MATRKLYVELAASIKRSIDANAGTEAGYQVELLALQMCIDLKMDNRNFNRDRFLRACGLPQHADN